MTLVNQRAFIETDAGLNRFDIAIAWYVYARENDLRYLLIDLKYGLHFTPAPALEADPRAYLDNEENENAREVYHYLIHPEERELTAPWPTFNRQDVIDAWYFYGRHHHRHDLEMWAWTLDKKTDAQPARSRKLSENARLIYESLITRATTAERWYRHMRDRRQIDTPRDWPRPRPDMSESIAETLRRTNDNKLPTYAWPGGYTLIALDSQNNTLCMDCANEQLRERDTPFWPRLEAYDTYDEGPAIQCDQCGKDIESSYGDPDQPDDDDTSETGEEN